MSLPQKTTNGNPDTSIIERVIALGDLSKLSPDERVRYYDSTCKSLGLNPLTKPFEYIVLNGQLRLYGNRTCADQLRKLHGISIQIVSEETKDGLLTVHVRATDRNGRQDEDIGVVNFPDTLKGDLRANTIMKAVTKAKRRVTMSISGLGFLDETEVEDIPRDNPHVTRPSDIVDVPAQDNPNRIPPGDPDIKRLPKKDARDIGTKLNLEMNAITGVEELREWAQDNRNRVALLPEDWDLIFQGRYVDHLTELLNKTAAIEAAANLDWLTELANAYAKCNSAAEIFQVDRELFEPVRPTTSLEEQLKASDIREEHLKRVAQ